MATKKIEYAINYYMSLLKNRPRELFSYFLVKGYKCTTISSVHFNNLENVLNAKMYLGMLITLIDDLADNPSCYNPNLSKIIYNNSVQKYNLSNSEKNIIKLKKFLFKNMMLSMKKLHNYDKLIDIFKFDLENIYLANKYFELVTNKYTIVNNYEIKLYGSYNMGIVAAGTIDLMGAKNICYEEIGKCREIFIIAQKISKIANTISTFSREEYEGDITNEISYLIKTYKNNFSFYKYKLEKDFLTGINLIKKSKNKIKNFNILEYVDGIQKLFELHMSLVGII